MIQNGAGNRRRDQPEAPGCCSSCCSISRWSCRTGPVYRQGVEPRAGARAGAGAQTTLTSFFTSCHVGAVESVRPWLRFCSVWSLDGGGGRGGGRAAQGQNYARLTRVNLSCACFARLCLPPSCICWCKVEASSAAEAQPRRGSRSLSARLVEEHGRTNSTHEILMENGLTRREIEDTVGCGIRDGMWF